MHQIAHSFLELISGMSGVSISGLLELPLSDDRLVETTNVGFVLAATKSHLPIHNCGLYSLSTSVSSVIPRLIEDMVPVSADSLSLKNSREAQVLRHLILRDDIVRGFGLTNDEFADLGTRC